MDPCDIPHTKSSINEPMASWLSAAGIFVSAVNPILIKNFGSEGLRDPKTDKADAKKIPRFALDRWNKLPQYGVMDETRNQLKTMSRQFGFYMDQKTSFVYARNPLMHLQHTIRNGANARATTSARARPRISIMPLLI